MHMQFGIFRSIGKFIPTYIHRPCVTRFLVCIRWIENKFVRKRFFVKKWNFFYMTSWRICSKGHSHFKKKKKKKKKKIRFRIFSLFLPSFEHREFWILCLISGLLWGVFDYFFEFFRLFRLSLFLPDVQVTWHLEWEGGVI